MPALLKPSWNRRTSSSLHEWNVPSGEQRIHFFVARCIRIGVNILSERLRLVGGAKLSVGGHQRQQVVVVVRSRTRQCLLQRGRSIRIALERNWARPRKVAVDWNSLGSTRSDASMNVNPRLLDPPRILAFAICR